MTTKAFTLLTLEQVRFVIIPHDEGIAVIDQDGYHYGSYQSRESFKKFVANLGLVGCRLGTARLEIVNRKPLDFKPDTQ